MIREWVEDTQRVMGGAYGYGAQSRYASSQATSATTQQTLKIEQDPSMADSTHTWTQQAKSWLSQNLQHLPWHTAACSNSIRHNIREKRNSVSAAECRGIPVGPVTMSTQNCIQRTEYG